MTTWTPPGTGPKLKTMICILLDRSGSMHGSEKDTVGGVNKIVEEQKKLDAPASITFVRFDGNGATNDVERFRPMTKLADVTPMTLDDFTPRGSTPLLDAIGRTLIDLEADWRREQPDRAIMVIVTDGGENASHEFSRAKVKEMIEARQKSDKWAFIYLGADVDAFQEASQLGIWASNTAGYTKSAKGYQTMTGAVGQSMNFMRGTGATHSMNLGKAQLGEDDDSPDVIGGPAAPMPTAPPPSTTEAWTPPS